jgi:hypothetical protein
MKENFQPKYKHDCKKCNFLGHVDFTIGEQDSFVDLYFCNQGNFNDTVIARFSSEGADYASGIYGVHYAVQNLKREKGLNVIQALEEIIKNPEENINKILGLAALRALNQNLITEDYFK